MFAIYRICATKCLLLLIVDLRYNSSGFFFTLLFRSLSDYDTVEALWCNRSEASTHCFRGPDLSDFAALFAQVRYLLFTFFLWLFMHEVIGGESHNRCLWWRKCNVFIILRWLQSFLLHRQPIIQVTLWHAFQRLHFLCQNSALSAFSIR